MIISASKADGPQIQSITARAGVFNEEEVDSVRVMFDEYLSLGTEGSGYNFLVYCEGEQVLGFAIYGYRDLTDGVYDLYWIAVDPDAPRALQDEVELGLRAVAMPGRGLPRRQAPEAHTERLGAELRAQVGVGHAHDLRRPPERVLRSHQGVRHRAVTIAP